MAGTIKIATRESYGNALVELAAEHDDIIVLDADLAGATKTGALVASSVVDSMSSAMPWAILAMMFAVAGATTIISALWASETWPTRQLSSRTKVSVATGLADRVSKVCGQTNLQAFWVMMTKTCAPDLRKREVRSQAL